MKNLAAILKFVWVSLLLTSCIGKLGDAPSLNQGSGPDGVAPSVFVSPWKNHANPADVNNDGVLTFGGITDDNRFCWEVVSPFDFKPFENFGSIGSYRTMDLETLHRQAPVISYELDKNPTNVTEFMDVDGDGYLTRLDCEIVNAMQVLEGIRVGELFQQYIAEAQAELEEGETISSELFGQLYSQALAEAKQWINSPEAYPRALEAGLDGAAKHLDLEFGLHLRGTEVKGAFGMDEKAMHTAFGDVLIITPDGTVYWQHPDTHAFIYIYKLNADYYNDIRRIYNRVVY